MVPGNFSFSQRTNIVSVNAVSVLKGKSGFGTLILGLESQIAPKRFSQQSIVANRLSSVQNLYLGQVIPEPSHGDSNQTC